jgi:diadenylate cyclase
MSSLLYNFWMHGARHVLDVLLAAYIFYKLMLVVRGTRSVQILQGILFLAVGTFLVNEVLHLPMMQWLLQKFWMAGLVILAVVFQPEIRSALAQLGIRQLSRWILPARFGFINGIIAALKECSEKRIGALIVLEQETGLKNYIETGTRINGEISSELILSLLHPRSPLHDGAIVISGAQLAAAGCLLPLTDDLHFAKLLGTRHRAAVGLSEFSDAVVLVVSEETGQISVARDGRLQREVDLNELRDQVYDLYRAKSEKPLLRKAGERA